MAKSILLGLVFYLTCMPIMAAALPNGFAETPSIIDISQVFSGGPPKDGIPAILKPIFDSVPKNDWLRDDDLLVSVAHEGEVRAYPLRILVWHEAVNDQLNGVPFLITYCPLCGSSVVFKSPPNTTFGISGLLYNSDVLLYDHQSESLWSQLMFKAVVGKRSGEELEVYPSAVVTWKSWKAAHPQGLVLSKNTGHLRDYSRDPYLNYRESTQLMFPVSKQNKKLRPKEQVFVVLYDNKAKAYPLDMFEAQGERFRDQDSSISIKVSNGLPTSATNAANKQLQTFNAYWFAWYTFRPDTEVYTSKH